VDVLASPVLIRRSICMHVEQRVERRRLLVRSKDAPRERKKAPGQSVSSHLDALANSKRPDNNTNSSSSNDGAFVIRFTDLITAAVNERKRRNAA
jgi:hypothetical protein